MSITLLVMTDGRDDILAQTMNSAMDNLAGDISRLVMHTDNGIDHLHKLNREYPDWEVGGGPRVGFGGAINRAWSFLADDDNDYIFHLEDDFTFNRPVDLDAMKLVLHYFPNIAQMALRRQPWNDAEREAGGIVEMWPHEYQDVFWKNNMWLEHRLFWTTNPAMYHKAWTEEGWPTVLRSESMFSDLVLDDPRTKCAFWGSRNDSPWVHHIGDKRVGSGY